MAPRDPAHFRPLLQATAVPDGDALVVLAARSELRIEGDGRLAGTLLALLDGTRTAQEVLDGLAPDEADDAAALIEELERHGAVVDCAEAWKRFHADSSIGSGYFREVDEELLAELAATTFRPTRTTGARVALEPADTSARELASTRRSSWPQDGPRAPELAELSALLAAMYSPTYGRHRVVPSAGGLYPLALHVAVRDPVGPLAPGVWWYDPAAGELLAIRAGAVDIADAVIPYAVHDPLLAQGTPLVVISADLSRPQRKYASRAYRFALMEAGAVMQQAYLAATELGLPIRAIGGIDDERAPGLLELPPDTVPLLGLLVGA